MAASKSLKATDRQNILKDVTAELKKRYKGNPPKSTRSVMETLLFAVLLEDQCYETAEVAFQKLFDGFFDLNEVRVSSITEVERVLGKIPLLDWKALRIREALQYIFEKQYSFDLEPLKRKTLEVAQKELDAFPQITPFAKSYVLQSCLGSHLIPLDPTMQAAVAWLGLTAHDSDVHHASEELKIATKKADAQYLCYLLKCLALDEKLSPAFKHIPKDVDPHEAVSRLKKLIKDGPAAVKPSPSQTVSLKGTDSGKGASKAHPKEKEEPKPVKKPEAPAPVTKADAPTKASPSTKTAVVTKTVTVKKPEQKAVAKKTDKPSSKAAPKKVTKKKPTKKPTSRPGKK